MLTLDFHGAQGRICFLSARWVHAPGAYGACVVKVQVGGDEKGDGDEDASLHDKLRGEGREGWECQRYVDEWMDTEIDRWTDGLTLERREACHTEVQLLFLDFFCSHHKEIDHDNQMQIVSKLQHGAWRALSKR